MGAHLIDGEFQSDKYPTTPRGKVPLSVKDPAAQDLLWEYAQRHRPIDPEFSEDLEDALEIKGYVRPIPQADENAFMRSTEKELRKALATAGGALSEARLIIRKCVPINSDQAGYRPENEHALLSIEIALNEIVNAR